MGEKQGKRESTHTHMYTTPWNTRVRFLGPWGHGLPCSQKSLGFQGFPGRGKNDLDTPRTLSLSENPNPNRAII